MATTEERNKKVKEVIELYNGQTKTMKIIGSTGNTYNVSAIKKNNKIVDVVCNCKGYYYRTKCWHTEKYSMKNPYWNKNTILKWKQ